MLFRDLLSVGAEELRDWEQYEHWQFEEQRSQKPFSPVLSKEAQQGMSVDYWPDVRMRTLPHIESSDLRFVGLVLASVINPDELHSGTLSFAFVPTSICEKQSGGAR